MFIYGSENHTLTVSDRENFYYRCSLCFLNVFLNGVKPMCTYLRLEKQNQHCTIKNLRNLGPDCPLEMPVSPQFRAFERLTKKEGKFPCLVDISFLPSLMFSLNSEKNYTLCIVTIALTLNKEISRQLIAL